VSSRPHWTATGCTGSPTLALVSTPASLNAPERLGRAPCAMPLIRHGLPLLGPPVQAVRLTTPAPGGHHDPLACSAHVPGYVPGHREQTTCCAGPSPRSKAMPMTPRTAHRRHQALDRYLADDKSTDSCRHLACAKRWLYQGRARDDAANPAWSRARSTRPIRSPPHTPAHVARAIVARHET